jgi:uncharacterized protein
MRTITLEEHFATPEFLDGPARDLKARAQQYGDRAAKLLEQLCDLGDKRIAEMDSAGIDVQGLSREPLSTVTIGAAIWTISFSGRS